MLLSGQLVPIVWLVSRPPHRWVTGEMGLNDLSVFGLTAHQGCLSREALDPACGL